MELRSPPSPTSRRSRLHADSWRRSYRADGRAPRRRGAGRASSCGPSARQPARRPAHGGRDTGRRAVGSVHTVLDDDPQWVPCSTTSTSALTGSAIGREPARGRLCTRSSTSDRAAFPVPLGARANACPRSTRRGRNRGRTGRGGGRRHPDRHPPVIGLTQDSILRRQRSVPPRRPKHITSACGGPTAAVSGQVAPPYAAAAQLPIAAAGGPQQAAAKSM